MVGCGRLFVRSGRVQRTFTKLQTLTSVKRRSCVSAIKIAPLCPRGPGGPCAGQGPACLTRGARASGAIPSSQRPWSVALPADRRHRVLRTARCARRSTPPSMFRLRGPIEWGRATRACERDVKGALGKREGRRGRRDVGRTHSDRWPVRSRVLASHVSAENKIEGTPAVARAKCAKSTRFWAQRFSVLSSG